MSDEPAGNAPQAESPSFSYLAAIVAGIVSIGAGGYLLLQHTVATDSVFNPLLHGLGAYFVARGVFMWWSGWRMSESAPSRAGRCPYCKEPLHLDASICPHCRSAIAPSTVASPETAPAPGTT